MTNVMGDARKKSLAEDLTRFDGSIFRLMEAKKCSTVFLSYTDKKQKTNYPPDKKSLFFCFIIG